MSDNGSTADAALSDSVGHRTFDGREHLSTRGEPVYGESVDFDGWCAWDAGHPELGAMSELSMDTGFIGGESMLYLEAASGTTISHVADSAGSTYAVEPTPRPVRDPVGVVEDRDDLFPLLKDACDPDSYAHVVEAGIDCLVIDVATRGQVAVAIRSRQSLTDDGRLLMAVKACSKDATAEPNNVFDNVIAEFDSTYELLETACFDHFRADRLGIVVRPKQAAAVGWLPESWGLPPVLGVCGTIRSLPRRRIRSAAVVRRIRWFPWRF